MHFIRNKKTTELDTKKRRSTERRKKKSIQGIRTRISYWHQLFNLRRTFFHKTSLSLKSFLYLKAINLHTYIHCDVHGANKKVRDLRCVNFASAFWAVTLSWKWHIGGYALARSWLKTSIQVQEKNELPIGEAQTITEYITEYTKTILATSYRGQKKNRLFQILCPMGK